MPKVQPMDAAPAGGRARARRVAPTLNEINVVPLVDVMLVLLIIFMVTAPMMQRGLDVNLPQSRRAQEINDQQRLYVTVPLTFRKDRKVRVGDDLVPFELLAERVRQAMRWKSEKQVFLQCDGDPERAGVHGRDGPPEGGRRRECRNRRAGSRKRADAEGQARLHPQRWKLSPPSSSIVRASRAG